MKKHVALSVLALTTVGLVLSHVGVERADNRFVLNVDGVPVDAWGALQDHMNRLTRQCDGVTFHTAAQAAASPLLQAVREYSPPDSRQLQWRQMLSLAQWQLLEVTFDTLEPAVMVVQDRGAPVSMQNAAIWSGPVAPWQPGPWIRTYLHTQAPAAPAQLLACYDPTPGLFKPV